MKKLILAFLFLMFSGAAHSKDLGGTSFQSLADTTTIYLVQKESVRRDIEAKKSRQAALINQIARQIEEARERSAKVLSKDELAKIKAQADGVIERLKREVEQLDAQIKEAEADGAMVFCSSQIITDEVIK